jgi:hypothetical protein
MTCRARRRVPSLVPVPRPAARRSLTTTCGGTWAVENDGTHVLQQTDTTISSSVYITPSVAGSANWTDYTVSADVKPGSDNLNTTSANLMGRYLDTNNHYSLILKNNSERWLGVKQAGNWSTIANGNFSYNSSTFYTLTLSLQGSTITGSIDGTVVGSGTDTTFSSGGIGFSTAANSELDNVSVVDGTGQGGGAPPPAPPSPASPRPVARWARPSPSRAAASPTPAVSPSTARWPAASPSTRIASSPPSCRRERPAAPSPAASCATLLPTPTRPLSATQPIVRPDHQQRHRERAILQP